MEQGDLLVDIIFLFERCYYYIEEECSWEYDGYSHLIIPVDDYNRNIIEWIYTYCHDSFSDSIKYIDISSPAFTIGEGRRFRRVKCTETRIKKEIFSFLTALKRRCSPDYIYIRGINKFNIDLKKNKVLDGSRISFEPLCKLNTFDGAKLKYTKSEIYDLIETVYRNNEGNPLSSLKILK